MRPDFVVGEKIAAIEPTQARGYFLPEPSVVIQIAFDELLYVVVCITAIFRGNACELLLQFGFKMHFHRLQIKKLRG